MKRKNPDNLDPDVRRAELLGYGIHYGRYKADYPNTKGMDPEQEDSDGIPHRVCAECGKHFLVGRVQGHRRYCTDECYRNNARKAAMNRYYKMKDKKEEVC